MYHTCKLYNKGNSYILSFLSEDDMKHFDKFVYCL